MIAFELDNIAKLDLQI